MIEYNGTQYDVPQSMLDAAIAFVGAVMPNASKDAKTAEIGKMLGKGTKLVKADAKGAHEKQLSERAASIAKDADFAKYARAVAQTYTSAQGKAKAFGEKVGFLPTPKRNGSGYVGQVPVAAFNAAKLVPFAGQYDATVYPKSDAPAGTLDPKDYAVQIELDLPELDKVFAEFRENRQKATDAALVYLKDATDYKLSVSETGELVLVDATTRGVPRVGGGERHATDAKYTGTWNGKTFTGTTRELVAALKAAGATIPATIEHNPSHIVTDKCPKSLGFTLKA